jgi:hypothetical protein
MKGTCILTFAGLCAAGFIMGAGFGSSVSAKDNIEVVRDKDKTSYVIESDDQAARDEERDKANAWRMLQNGNMWIDGRGRQTTPQPAGK